MKLFFLFPVEDSREALKGLRLYILLTVYCLYILRPLGKILSVYFYILKGESEEVQRT